MLTTLSLNFHAVMKWDDYAESFDKSAVRNVDSL